MNNKRVRNVLILSWGCDGCTDIRAHKQIGLQDTTTLAIRSHALKLRESWLTRPKPALRTNTS